MPAASPARNTASTVAVASAKACCSSGDHVSSGDTVLAAVKPDAQPQDLVQPGHIFPLRARDGGVMVRVGQTEGSVDLARLVGLKPAGVICEITDDDGNVETQVISITVTPVDDVGTFSGDVSATTDEDTATAGTVTFAKRNGNFGLTVKIKHGNGIETVYAHVLDIKVKQGQKVERGEVIARVAAHGVHRHYKLPSLGHKCAQPVVSTAAPPPGRHARRTRIWPAAAAGNAQTLRLFAAVIRPSPIR